MLGFSIRGAVGGGDLYLVLKMWKSRRCRGEGEMRIPAETVAYIHSSFLLYTPASILLLCPTHLLPPPPLSPAVGVKYITCLLIKPPLQVWRERCKKLKCSHFFSPPFLPSEVPSLMNSRKYYSITSNTTG